MIRYLKRLDTFSKNILLVFLGTSLLNIFSLLYQLLIAHALSAADFASFNSLLVIYMLISAPIGNLQPVLTKYVAEFNACGKTKKSETLLVLFLKITIVLGALTFFLTLLFSSRALHVLKIECVSCGYLLSALLGLAWVVPVFLAGLQGSELFAWLAASTAIGGAAKLLFALVFVGLGLGVSGALAALLLSALAGMLISIVPIRHFFRWMHAVDSGVDLGEVFTYLLPVTASSFCFIALASFDMVMVKYFFSPVDSGTYSLAQMVGKIFLFLPSAISIVMFPKAAGLNAKNLDTTSTLKKSLFYACLMSVTAALAYNMFPAFFLRVLTGKVFPESIALGRLFSVSMTFWTLVSILIAYFISIRDLRFLKYLLIFTAAQLLAVAFFHQTLMQVQQIICVNAALLFFIYFSLAGFKKGPAYGVAS
jgi:O-antigen/teichoic acid export membrane protein